MASNNLTTEEIKRASQLLSAQDKAVLLFEEIERDLVRHGVTEKKLNEEIYQLGLDRYGIKTHWYKRVIRSGPNTLSPFSENPPDRVIQPDDILVVDLGPVFEAWEATLGVPLSSEMILIRGNLRDALEPIWNTVKTRYRQNPDMSGEELYAISCEIAKQEGWDFGADIAGHLVDRTLMSGFRGIGRRSISPRATRSQWGYLVVMVSSAIGFWRFIFMIKRAGLGVSMSNS